MDNEIQSLRQGDFLTRSKILESYLEGINTKLFDLITYSLKEKGNSASFSLFDQSDFTNLEISDPKKNICDNFFTIAELVGNKISDWQSELKNHEWHIKDPAWAPDLFLSYQEALGHIENRILQEESTNVLLVEDSEKKDTGIIAKLTLEKISKLPEKDIFPDSKSMSFIQIDSNTDDVINTAKNYVFKNIKISNQDFSIRWKLESLIPARNITSLSGRSLGASFGICLAKLLAE